MDWLGIDFGTSYSSAAYVRDGSPVAVKFGHNLTSMPSSASVDGQGELRVGRVAENRRRLDPTCYRREFKLDLGSRTPYQMGGRELLPEELVTAVLAEFRREAGRQAGTGQPPHGAVITVPADYQKQKRLSMQRAAEAAGFAAAQLLEEPVAAALYHARRSAPEREGEVTLVYDLGGGTFDAALIRKQGAWYQTLALPVGARCGGVDFDRAVFNLLRQGYPAEFGAALSGDAKKVLLTRLLLADACRELKHRLSEEEEVEELLMLPDSPPLEVRVRREEFDEAISPLVAETCELSRRMVESAGLSMEAVGRVLLVGGSCRIPFVREAVERLLGRPSVMSDEPELAVSLGAALYSLELPPPPTGPVTAADIYRCALELTAASGGNPQAEALRGQLLKMRTLLGISRVEAEAVELEAAGRAGLNRASEYAPASGRAGGVRGAAPTAEVEGISLKMVWVPGGSFLMGSLPGELGRETHEGPQHQVTVQGFYLGECPVTQGMWRAVMGGDPSYFKGEHHPVEQVVWHEAVEFCRRLSERSTGMEFRLPSEAEWEYACRAGTNSPFYFGVSLSTAQANFDGRLFHGGGEKGGYRMQTTGVAEFGPNGWGLYDMHGNVWEWCQDFWHDTYDGAPSDGSAWLTGGNRGLRVVRGGSWFNYPSYCRSASRQPSHLSFRNKTTGFRIAWSGPPPETR